MKELKRLLMVCGAVLMCIIAAKAAFGDSTTTTTIPAPEPCADAYQSTDEICTLFCDSLTYDGELTETECEALAISTCMQELKTQQCFYTR